MLSINVFNPDVPCNAEGPGLFSLWGKHGRNSEKSYAKEAVRQNIKRILHA